MIIKASENQFFLLLPQLYSELEFIAAARAHTGSPAEELAHRLYWCLFNSSVDIIGEYNRYYKEEYNTMWKFLFWHYCFSSSLIYKIRDAFSTSKKHLLYGDIYGGGDYAAGQYIMSEEGLKVIEKILKRIPKESKK